MGVIIEYYIRAGHITKHRWRLTTSENIIVAVLSTELFNFLGKSAHSILDLAPDCPKFALIANFHHQVKEFLLLCVHVNNGWTGSSNPPYIPISDRLVQLILYILLRSVYFINADQHIAESLLNYVLEKVTILRDLIIIVFMIFIED
jgi:hypothetical protein